MTEDKKDNFWKSNLLFPALAISFFFGFFIPVSMYIGNVQEFPQTRPLLLIQLALGIFVIFALLLLGLFYVLNKLLPRICTWAVVLLSGLTVAFYIQGNLINLNYGVLDGKPIPWDKMFAAGILNTAIWLVILAASIAVVLIWRKRVIRPLGNVMLYFLLFMVLTVTLRLATMTNESYYPATFTAEYFSDVSKERNIIVIIVDTLEQELFERFLAEYPPAKEILQDFTYYRDTVGKLPTTLGALPHIITGIPNDNTLSLAAYKNKAFQTSPLFEKARENDFSVYFYVNSIFAPSPQFAEQQSFIKNIATNPVQSRDVWNYYANAWNSSIFTYLPHFVKRYHAKISLPELQNEYEKITGLNSAVVENKFIQMANSGKLNVCIQNNALKFYHLRGVHYPDYTVQMTTKIFLSIKSFIKCLKDAGVYENTSILILADHGSLQPERPIFLCNNSSGKFTVQDKPFSFDLLLETYTRLMEKKNAEIPSQNGPRSYFHYAWDDNWDRRYLPEITERYIMPDGTIQTPKPKIYKDLYKAADLLHLPSKNFSWEQNGRWTVAKSAELYIPLSPLNQNKELTLTLDTFAYLAETMKSQDLELFVNGKKMFSHHYHFPEETRKQIKITIPSDLNTKPQLDLRFQVANPTSPSQLNPNDKDIRTLGVYLSACRINPTDMRKNSFNFSLDDSACFDLTNGFSDIEQTGVWTSGNRSTLTINLPDDKIGKNIRIDLTIYPLPPKQHLKISSENVVLMDKEIKKCIKQTLRLHIPAEHNNSSKLRLDFELPDANSPQKLGINDDTRILAVQLIKCNIKTNKKK